jgi:polyhydroxybutyrate depolymerase
MTLTPLARARHGALAVLLLLGSRWAPAAQDGAQHITAGGQDRSFLLHRPAGLDRRVPVPLVIMLHGGFGSASQAQKSYNWNALADHEGFVVAYPDGTHRSWNAGGICCGPALRAAVDDVGFVTELIQRVSAQENIDPRRVYLTGMSNGAAMVYRYACEGSYPVAAIGPVAGTFSFDCPRAHPVSVMAIHGLADEHVPFAGGQGAKGVTHGDWVPVQSTLDTLRRADACGAPVTVQEPPMETTSSACAQGRAVVLVAIAGAGHQWPGSAAKGIFQKMLGGDQPSTAMDATRALWTFFRAHPAPPPP